MFPTFSWNRWLSGRRTPIRRRRPYLEQMEDRALPSGFSELGMPGVLDAVTAVQTSLTTALNTASKIPLLSQNGAGILGNVSQANIITSGVVTQIRTALNSPANDTDAKMAAALEGALGLQPGDVKISHQGGDDGRVAIEVHLHRDLAAATLPADFALNLGLSGLPVHIGASTSGSITAKVGYDYAFAFGWDGTKLVVDTAAKLSDFGALPPNQLVLEADVAPSADFKATATVGLLQAIVSEKAGNTSKLAATFAVNNLGLGTTPTVALTGSANFNLHAAASFASTTDTNGSGAVFAFPGIGADLVINNWAFPGGKPDVAFNNVSFELGSFISDFVGPILRDIQTFTQPIQPIIDVLTAPLPALSDLSHVIGEGDVTILGIAQAYASSGAGGPGISKLIQLVGILTDITKGINSIDVSSGTVMVPLGSFSLNSDAAKTSLLNDVAGSPGSTPGDLAPKLLDEIGSGADTIKDIADAAAKTIPGNNPASDAARSALKKLGDFLDPNFKLNFPILDDPKSVIFPMLLGHDGELASFDANFKFDAPMDVGYSMFGVGISAKGTVSAEANIHVGYDTYGLRKFFSDLTAPGGSVKPADLLDGFFVTDPTPDKPQFKVAASLGIGAGVTIGFYGVSVDGGAYTGGSFSDPDPIVLGFHDPDAATDDGKLRLSNIGKDKGRIFDVVGKLKAGVSVTVKVGYDAPVVGFIGFKHTFDIASVDLFDLRSIDPETVNGQQIGHLGKNGIPSGHPPVLAGLTGPDGAKVLTLFLGANVGGRQNVPVTTDDKPETWEVSHESDGSVTVKAFGATQNFAGVTKIVAVGAKANQSITVDDGVTADAELTGGDGDDQLTYLGSGKATLSGGDGNDRLAVGAKSKDSELHGGKGNDDLIGGGGNDHLYGDGDNDILFAGTGNQYLDGGAGDDQLSAGKGSDTERFGPVGGTGSNRVGDGSDSLYGGDGNDIIDITVDKYAKPGTTAAHGGDGFDLITVTATAGAAPKNVSVFGDAGKDTLNVLATSGATDIHGGDDDDSITVNATAGAGPTSVFGDPGRDTIDVTATSGMTDVHGGGDDDKITLHPTNTGNGPTSVFGDAGRDTIDILSTSGATDAHGGDDSDNITVNATAGAGPTHVFGDAGNDTIKVLTTSGVTDVHGGDDEDSITVNSAGGASPTSVYGDKGNDTIDIAATTSATDAHGGDDNDSMTLDAQVVGGPTTLFGDDGRDTINLLAVAGAATAHGGNDGDTITLRATTVVGPTFLYGDAGADQLLVDRLPNGAVANLDGGAGPDTDTVNTVGSGGSLVEVSDSGAVSQDTLVVNGTGLADNFLLRAASAPPDGTGVVPGGVALVAALHGDPVTAVERINYTQGFGGLVLNLGDGDDRATLDDNWAPTTVKGGNGQDHFQVGQIFKSPRDSAAGVAGIDLFDTDQSTRGFLSHGVSAETTINGEGDNDDFTVFRNKATLNLNGNDGNDTFTVRAFALEGSTDTNVVGGKDVDLIQYVLNAKVNVDGGDGTDTLRIIGTEFADRFLVTKNGIFGAGLNVSYKNIEKLEVDGAEGDDEFYVLSTGLTDPVSGNAIDVSIYGGLGNDLFSIAGDSAAVQKGTTKLPAAVQPHRVNLIQGALHVDGAGGKGSAGGLGTPVMLPGETSQLASDGKVLAYTGTGTGLSADTLTVPTAKLLAALPGQPPPNASLGDLVGRTVEISKGPGLGRFWQITDVGAAVGGQTVLALRSPGVPADEWGLPDTTSEFALTHLSRNFFVSEADTLDSMTVFNDGSSTDDAGALSATGLTGLGMAPTGITYGNLETVEVLLGTGKDTFAVTGTAAGAITAVHGGGGDDRITVTGGGGPGSPLLVYGDTTVDRTRYSSDGSASSAGTYQADGVTPKPGAAFAFATDGNDTIDASADAQSVAIYGGGGSDTIRGSQAGDHLAGGAGDDEVHGQAGADHIYGDSGFNQDLTTRLDHLTPATQVLRVVTTEAAGNDKLSGDGGDDILFGDHGVITQTPDTQRILTTGNVTRVETTNPANGGNDEMNGGADNDVGLGGAGNDRMGGDAGQDLLLGDQATLVSRPDGSMTSPRFRTLVGTQLYDAAGNAQVTAAWQTPPGAQPAWANWTITLDAGNAGNDYLAGGAGNDVAFGQAGDDTIQGDGSITLDVGTPAAPGQSAEDAAGAGTDGDDYAEGGGGNDLIFGDLGQDDLIGGSSNLFGQAGAAQRGDGSDAIFGGAGARIARNDPGDSSPAGHARDADTILGDNGNIYRVLGAGGNPLAFAYDSYGPSKVAVRAVSLLDYTPGGGAGDLGGADVVRGEAGDDEVHGQTGNDVLLGDGQDDDLYGESGSDRISGGAGEDGVLGDDGRIQTSRNGLAEPLYGFTTANAQTQLSVPGPWTGAWEYVTGRLSKAPAVAAWPVGGNDVIYGGLGDDFLHGGAGDDAISGAEAQAAFYTAAPVTNTNPLGYDATTRKLAAYDANNPLRRIDGFFLNFDAVDAGGQKVEDGKDRIFGDNGNDWVIGGTGNDRLFGGKGDDLLDADDNLDTAGGLNNQPDAPLFADRDFAYGGDGLDVLIANTGGDRLFDWGGEFNSYVVPFSPFGNPTVVRSPNPQIQQFLLDLGRTSGADQALTEPNGEVGLFRQSDPEWGQNHGGPRDPQPGNTHARRDTQGGPEDDRGTPAAAAQANTSDVSVNNVVVSQDPSDPSRLALFVGGTSGDDVIQVRAGSTAGSLQVMINGVDRGTFARTTTAGTIGRVIVYGNDGNDAITVSSTVDAIAAVLYGGAGNDTLTGGKGSNFLDGGDGNDALTGSAANDILVGGLGQDTVSGAGGDDILIGGLYLASEDLDAVAAVTAEWSSARSYSQRVANLRSGVGADAAYQLNPTTLLDDFTVDSLYGGQGQDWFWAFVTDGTDQRGNETNG
jgi:Ca2+-binding RTX toxin-like protein